MLVSVLVLTLLMLAFSPQSGWSLTVQTDRPYYTVGDRLYISGRLTYNDWPDQGVQVTVTVKTPTGALYYLASSTTDYDGKYNANTTLGGLNAILGQYTVTATASPVTPTTSSTTFLLIDRICIEANGDVSPSSAPISRSGDAYWLTDSITGNLVDGIVIQRNNTILDGAGFTLQGKNVGGSNGIYLINTDNVTVRDVTTESFQYGIWEMTCSYGKISETNVSFNGYGMHFQSCSFNTIEGSIITNNTMAGIDLELASQNNTVSKNNLANTISSSGVGAIRIEDFSNYNIISDNYLTSNAHFGVYIGNSWGNEIFHNSFINNTSQAFVADSWSKNTWDDGYPSGGNYWNDYRGVDNFSGPYQNETGSDGIGDTPCVIDASNRDNYPLMSAWDPTRLPAETVHLLLTVDPNQARHVRNQLVTLRVNVLNQLLPSLESTLTLTITGPGDHYYFDFQNINVKADGVGDYSFTWDIPNVAGTYVIEVSLIPPQLTAYDAVWLEVA